MFPQAAPQAESAPTTNGSRPVTEQQEPIRDGILPLKKRGVYEKTPEILKRSYLERKSTIPSNQQIIASKIMARATIRITGADHVIIVAAFQLSHERAFWFVFKSKTARSPRKTWKQTRCLPARTTFPKTTPINMEWVVDSVTGGQPSKVTKRYSGGKKYFIDHLTKITNPTYITPDGDYQNQTKMVNRRNGWKPKNHRRPLFTVGG